MEHIIMHKNCLRKMMHLEPVWCGAETATACLSSGARFGRHNFGSKSVARCGVGGGQPNRPLAFQVHKILQQYRLVDSPRPPIKKLE
jgi:hypothetical protein